ncbi:hypothetical protein NIES4102_43520 (plasmid) [Chondrocystis sp. NIES-4102]|nr:hypothetical protein NIES4102_43520 [Chondrocystis sp. NIES-4102]
MEIVTPIVEATALKWIEGTAEESNVNVLSKAFQFIWCGGVQR